MHYIFFHCSITMTGKVDFDFSSSDTISPQDIKSFESKVKWFAQRRGSKLSRTQPFSESRFSQLKKI
ncbi:hypothetical protein TL16_g08026 [Triparma laevis f. inornata]|uniref:Uncharacterized protein n=1 Tax=Triparma laevis f. inornata TaxID=1714386 RepID=A0A9W7AYW4_9STRA|nr:hypothetical protein TL16_g08026 [Triparma laevis f. inornata]